MRTQDDERWSQQVTDLHSDGEAGQRFLDFFQLWFDGAEIMMWEGTGGQTEPEPNMSAIEAVRLALMMAEEQLGFLTTELIGQMLTLATMHWAHGAVMAEQMTNIENRVMQEALARKIAELQQAASTPE